MAGSANSLTRGGAIWRLAALPVVLFAVTASAQGQSAGAVEPRFALPPLTLPAPLSESDHFVVTRFVFEGHTAVTTPELEALAAPFLDHPIRFVELEELRQRISRAYVDRGYVSSGAVIPDDPLRAGTLRIRIVEGVVSQVRVKGLERLSQIYVASRLVRPGELLDVNRLEERFRLLLTDPLFERVNARLLPGLTLGSSIVDVDVVRARPYRFSLFAHNYQAAAVGSAVAGLDANVRNLSGWGDNLAATLTKSNGSDNADIAWTLPITARSTFVTLRLAQGMSSVVEEPVAALDIGSRVKTHEITLGHPVIESARRNLTLGLSLSQRSSSTTLDGQPFSFVAGESSGTVEVKSWRLFQDLVMRFPRHVLALRSTFVFGRNNVVADDAVPAQPATRYRFWVGQVQSAIDLGHEGSQLLLRGQLQASEDRLVPLEQLSVGGRYTVRGYRENQLVRDGGYALSAEYHRPLLSGDTPGRKLTLIPFIDLGAAGNQGAGRERLASVGLGLQWAFGEIEGELFCAKRLERRAVDSSGDLQDRGIHLSLRWRPI